MLIYTDQSMYVIYTCAPEIPLLFNPFNFNPFNSNIFQQLIKTCGLSSNNPLAAEELMFLRTLCVKLQQDPTLSNFFIEVHVHIPLLGDMYMYIAYRRTKMTRSQ